MPCPSMQSWSQGVCTLSLLSQQKTGHTHTHTHTHTFTCTHTHRNTHTTHTTHPHTYPHAHTHTDTHTHTHTHTHTNTQSPELSSLMVQEEATEQDVGLFWHGCSLASSR